MAKRTLDQISDAEWNDLKDELYSWLDRVDCAGSVAAVYSLYDGLDDEREHALRVASSLRASEKSDS